MSIQLAKLCSIIFERHFGKNVQVVGDCLFSAVQSRSLSMIVKYTGLSRNDAGHALAVLIKFRLVKFDSSVNENSAEYSLNRDNILLILRFPRYDKCAIHDKKENLILIYWYIAGTYT